MNKIPLRGENETVEDWYPRFRVYEEVKAAELKYRMEEHLERVNQIHKEYHEVMEKFHEENKEIAAIQSDIAHLTKEIKERKENVQV